MEQVGRPMQGTLARLVANRQGDPIPATAPGECSLGDRIALLVLARQGGARC